MTNQRSCGIVPYKISKNKIYILLIKHKEENSRGHWSFPKGHQESNETDIQTAKREFYEETGINEVRIYPGIYFYNKYTFKSEGKIISKTVKYFLGKVMSPVIKVQKSEIETFGWFEINDGIKRITYANDKKILFKISRIFDEKKIKRILLIDFNGVISSNDFFTTIKTNDFKLWKKIDTFLFNNHKVEIQGKWLRGELSTEQVILLLARGLKLNYRNLMQNFVNDLKNIDLSKVLLNKITQLNKQFHCILVTNNYDCFNRFVVEFNYGLTDTFDGIYNSSDFNLLKTENSGELFKIIISDFQKSFDNAFLIDDSDVNLQTFSQLGGNIHKATEIEETVKYLQSLKKQKM